MGSDDLFKRSKELKEFKRNLWTRGSDRDRILVVCEGEETERNYFEGFRLTNVTVKGTGYNTESLVRKAIALRDQAWANASESVGLGGFLLMSKFEILLIRPFLNTSHPSRI